MNFLVLLKRWLILLVKTAVVVIVIAVYGVKTFLVFDILLWIYHQK